MAKHTNEAQANFGHRLAALRKAAGFTQQELADEIGASRRMIAYYEAESGHLPANLLAQIAHALSVSADALLGLQEISAAPRASHRLERRLKQIDTLNPKAKRQLTQLIDTFIEAEQFRQQHSRGRHHDQNPD